LKIRNLIIGCTFYLLFPILLFLLTWLAEPLNYVLTVFIGAIYIKYCKKIYAKFKLYMPVKHKYTLQILEITLCILLLTGHGGLLSSNGVDIPWRDAIYYDLISHSWPVIYQSNGTALTYYLSYWLPAAGFSSALGLSHYAAQVVLFLWTLLGLFLGILLLCSYLHSLKRSSVYTALLFLFWSSISIIGMIIRSALGKERPLAIEDMPGFNSWQFTSWSHDGYFIGFFIRTTFDSLANVYNQFVPLFLCTMLFLHLRKELRYYALIGLLALPYSPFGFIGFSLVMLLYFFAGLIKCQEKRRRLLECLSLENFSSMATILPVYAIYYTSNAVSTATGSKSIWIAPLSDYGVTRISNLLLFYLLAFGIYVSCLPKRKWNWLVINSVFLLCIFPMIQIGNGGDFLWNASTVPGLLIMVFVIGQIQECIKRKQVWGKNLFLIICVCLGILTPIMQASSYIRTCVLVKQGRVYIDPMHINGTFEDKNIQEYRNFLSIGYEDTYFYKYIAKKK